MATEKVPFRKDALHNVHMLSSNSDSTSRKGTLAAIVQEHHGEKLNFL
jgi:hypothetical protein